MNEREWARFWDMANQYAPLIGEGPRDETSGLSAQLERFIESAFRNYFVCTSAHEGDYLYCDFSTRLLTKSLRTAVRTIEIENCGASSEVKGVALRNYLSTAAKRFRADHYRKQQAQSRRFVQVEVMPEISVPPSQFEEEVEQQRAEMQTQSATLLALMADFCATRRDQDTQRAILYIIYFAITSQFPEQPLCASAVTWIAEQNGHSVESMLALLRTEHSKTPLNEERDRAAELCSMTRAYADQIYHRFKAYSAKRMPRENRNGGDA